MNAAKTDRVTIENVTMAVIPSGSFMMGSDWMPEEGVPETLNAFYPDEQPVHRVEVKAFRLGVVTVTQEQFEAVMGYNPSTFKGSDLPVTNTGAGEVEKYLNGLSRRAGLEPVYHDKTRAADVSKNGFRLPTEAEWEYACRAGTSTRFHTGDTEADLARTGWYLGNSGRRTHPVGQKEPNAWGLYDMHGNVFELVEDDWNPSMAYGRYLPEGSNPTYNYYHDMRIARGGSWFSEPSVCRSAARSCFCNWPQLRQCWYVGFRTALNA
jgi:formylglycine-generating enzyme required for sulfatase activity